jgi:translation initiation factor IF-1
VCYAQLTKELALLVIMPSPNEQQAVDGVVVEALPDGLFRVEVKEGEPPILAYLGGKMRYHKIRVLVGDKVSVVLDPYGGRARIVRRHLERS